MLGQAFQVQGLEPARGQAAQHLGLGRSGVAVDQDEVELAVFVIELRLHLPAIGAVAAVQHGRPPAHLGQDGRHGVRALAAAPAVDQRPERTRLVRQGGFQVMGHVAGHQRRPDAARLEAGVLDIDGSDLRPLLIVEHRHVDRARDVVLGELGRAAHVDDHVEARQGGGVRRGDDLDVRHDGGGGPGYRGPQPRARAPACKTPPWPRSRA